MSNHEEKPEYRIHADMLIPAAIQIFQGLISGPISQTYLVPTGVALSSPNGQQQQNFSLDVSRMMDDSVTIATDLVNRAISASYENKFVTVMKSNGIAIQAPR